MIKKQLTASLTHSKQVILLYLLAFVWVITASRFDKLKFVQVNVKISLILIPVNRAKEQICFVQGSYKLSIK